MSVHSFKIAIDNYDEENKGNGYGTVILNDFCSVIIVDIDQDHLTFYP